MGTIIKENKFVKTVYTVNYEQPVLSKTGGIEPEVSIDRVEYKPAMRLIGLGLFVLTLAGLILACCVI